MSNDVEPAVARWRKLAADALEAAAEMTDPEAKAIMFDIAERYERVAQHVEARSENKKPE